MNKRKGVKNQMGPGPFWRIVPKGAWPLLGLIFLFPACSPQKWQAKIHMFQAENAYTKAYEMRIKKNVDEERRKLYRFACDHFLKAYQLSPEAYTLNRIAQAAEACLWVRDFEKVEKFREFEEIYVKEHPTEVEYGDAVPMLEGE